MDQRLIFRYFSDSVDGVTQFDKLSDRMVGRLSHKSVPAGKSTGTFCRRVVGDSPRGGNSIALSWLETLLDSRVTESVPQTDTGG